MKVTQTFLHRITISYNTNKILFKYSILNYTIPKNIDRISSRSYNPKYKYVEDENNTSHISS